jgi:outer membrane immunogenic protein
MKYLLGAVSAAVLLTSSAFAADMPTKARVAYPASPVNWTGCYVGVNGGGGWSREDRTLTSAIGLPVNQAQGSVSANGAAAGGQIGCDYQFNSTWVVGIRGMWDWSNIKGSNAVALPNVGNVTDETNDTKVKSFGTLTGRLGYLVSPTVMLYGLGGVAWARSEYAISSAALGGQTFTGAATRVGYDVGLGLSWMFMPNWNLWLEYDHMGFANKTVTLNGVGVFAPLFVGVDMKQNIDKVLVGLDYRFSLGR